MPSGLSLPLAFGMNTLDRELQLSHDLAQLERFAGWGLHPLESAALSRRTPDADITAFKGLSST
jgi:hypothetical protein